MSVIIGLLLTAGIVIALLGLRGRRIDDHPWCAKCGFDLFGSPNETATCPECGSDLNARSALRHGQRRRIPAMIIAGSLLLLFPVTWLAIGLAGANLNPYKPAWLLVLETDSRAERRDPALAELSTRLIAGTLNAEHAGALVDRALAIQADPDAAWSATWGDFVELAIAGGQASKADAARYYEQGVQFDVKMRPRIRSGGKLALQIAYSRVRLGSTTQSLQMGGFDYRSGNEPWANLPSGSFGTSASTGATSQHVGTSISPINLPPGEHELAVRFDCSPTITWNKPLHTWTIEHTGEVEVTPPDVHTVELRPAPELAAEIGRAITVQQLSIRPPNMVTVMIQFDPLPMPVAFDVFARTAAGEVKLGSMSCEVSTGRQSKAFGNNFNPGGMALGEAVDIVLKPSVEQAESTIDLTEIWEGEIVIEDVLVGP